MLGFTLSEEQEAFRQAVRALAEGMLAPQVEELEAKEQFPMDVFREMGRLGYLGVGVPEAEGGSGGDMVMRALLLEEIARVNCGLAAALIAHVGLCTTPLIKFATREQQERYLRPALSGEKLGCFGLSEPDAGSDAAGLRTTAVRDGDHYVINGTKMFITNAVYGDVVFLAARTDAENRYGISMFIVEKDREGFSVAQKLDKHGWRCSDTAELVLDDVWVPDENLLGTEHRGFYEIMKNFQNERMVISAEAVGAAQAAIDLTLEHTQTRRAFGGVLFDKQAIRQRLAMAQAKVDACRAAVYQGAWMMESGLDATKYMSGVKAFANETVNEVMYECTQFHGGMGFMTETPVVRLYRDARINTIGGGATEVMLEEVAKRSIVV